MRNLGFIGLGAIGTPMAKTLCTGGFNLSVFDVLPERIRPLEELGAHAAHSPREASEEADAVIIMVMNAVQAEEALFGEDGVVHGLRQHSVVVIMSTLGPEKLRELGNRLEEFEFRVLDAPVTGGAARAEQGDLVVLAGGDEGLLEELQPVLGALGSSIVHCGTSVGDGQAVKMVNQLLVGIHLAAAGEALAYAEALGLNPRAVFETVKQGAANSFMLEHRGETMLSGDFTPRGSKLQVLIKDMGFVVESAKRYGFTASLASSANEIYQRAADLGFGDEEDAGIARMFGRSQTDAPEMED